MGRDLPQVYEVVTYNAAQTELETTHLVYSSYSLPGFKPLELDVNEEREVHFHAVQNEVAGAVDHRARLMKPRETRQLLRKVERETLVNEFVRKATDLIGLRKYIEYMPVMAAADEPNSRYAI